MIAGGRPAGRAVPGRSVLGNFLSLSAATWTAQALGFLVVVYVARVFGARALGQIALAQAVVLQFRFVADLGLDLTGSRRVAADRAGAAAVVTDLAGARLINAAIAGVVLLAAAAIIDRFVPAGAVVVGFGLSLACWALSLEWVFMGLERMDLVGLARLSAAVVWLVMVVLLGRAGTTLLVVPAGYVTGQAVAAGVLYANFRRAHGSAQIRSSKDAWLRALRRSAPIGLSLIVVQVQVGFGLVALGLLDGDRSAGVYAAPQRLVLFLTAGSSMFGAALYPRLAAVWAEGQPAFERVLGLGVRMMAVVSLPLAVGGVLVAGPLVRFVYGGTYSDAVSVCRWLMPVVVPIYVSTVLGYALLAAGRERHYLMASILGASVVVAANLALIPRWHWRAPAVATLAAECAVFFAMVAALRPAARVAECRTVAVAAASTALMTAALLLSRGAPLALQTGLGAVTYLAAIVGLGGVTSADVRLLADLARSAPPGPSGSLT